MNDSNKHWEDVFEQLPFEPIAREEHHQQLKNQALTVFDNSQQSQAFKLKHIGRTLMKYKVPQLAAAVIAIVAAMSMFNFSGPAAFAIETVVAKLVNAKSARWESVIDLGVHGKQTLKTAIIPGRTREEDEDGSVTIMDWTTGQALSLLPDSKTALRMNLGNEAKELDSFNAFQAMRDSLASSLEAGGLKDVESLGKKTFDGRELIGFRIHAVHAMTIWADPETEVAVQIEIQLGDNGPNLMMKNYESDFPVDEALFSLDIPAGYQTTDMKLPTSQPSEAELIKSLKLSCEYGDGTFPKGLDITSIANASANIQVHLIDSMNLGTTAATGEQIAELTKASIGFNFAIQLAAGGDSDAHYAGANVKLGEKDRPIFWYKPMGSEKYRVIFADLTVTEQESAPTVSGAAKLTL